MTAPPGAVARVVVEVEPFHLDRSFDYLVPAGVEVVAGQRVQVPFSGRLVRGLVVEVAAASQLPEARLKPLKRVLGDHVWVREEELELLRWAADRFGAPLAHVVRHALPARTVDVERRAAAAGWYPPGSAVRPRSDPPPDPAELAARWAPYGAGGHRLVEQVASGSGSFLWRPLPGEDLGARLAELTQLALAGDRDVLVLVPDPASPVADAVVRSAGDLAVDLRGGPSPRRTYRAWLEARCGAARVVVGERGAAFLPLERLGLAVVVDEANPAYKERRSPRHHARDVVLERARRARGVGLVIGTVPSAVAWGLLRERRIEPVVPDREQERAHRPRVVVATQQQQPRARLSREAMAALRAAVAAGGYGVVLAARRGQGAAVVCAGCGERRTCPRCAASLAVAEPRGLRCTTCGWQVPGVPSCGACRDRRVVPLAAGAARYGEELARAMEVPVAVLEGYGQPAPPPPAVLVLTRGSVLDAPPGPVGAVVLPDLDGLLRRPVLDAAEDTLRLACAVAGWTVHGRVGADRGEPAAAPVRAGRAGELPVVVAQTREPDHPAVQALARWDPGGFWRAEVALRAPLGFPPVRAAVRVEADLPGEQLLAQVQAAVGDQVTLLGPVPAAGRAGLLCLTDERAALLAALAPLRSAWSREGRDVRVDVDPVSPG